MAPPEPPPPLGSLGAAGGLSWKSTPPRRPPVLEAAFCTLRLAIARRPAAVASPKPPKTAAPIAILLDDSSSPTPVSTALS